MTAEHAASPLRMLYQGLAVACAAGLITGAAMKPDQRELDGPEGPQMLAGTSGERIYRSGYTAADLVSRSGPAPDYVIGADWLHPPAYPVAAAYAAATHDYDYDGDEYEELPPVTYAGPAPYELADLEPAPPPRIPSLDGDVLGGIGATPPPLAETIGFEPPA